MSVMNGCEGKYKTPVPEERKCPKCGKEVEVFTMSGKIVEDTPCACGYVFQAEEVESLKVERKDGK